MIATALSSSPVSPAPAAPAGATAAAPDELLGLARAVFAETEPQAVLAAALDALVELAGAERGLLLLFDDDGEPRFEAARSLDRAELDRPELEVSRSILDAVRASGEPCFRANALEDPELGPRESVLRLRILSVICLPVRRDDATFGVVYLDHRRAAGAFDRATAELAGRFADLVAPAAWNARERALLERRVERLSAEVTGRAAFASIVTRDPAMLRALELVAQVAPSEAPVLLRGASGTGKELVARALHRASGRRRGPFVAVNCGALPESLLEAELFGHVRGAFTGAVRDAPGWFERARGGTLFLDEIGEMSPACQAKVLRVLDRGELAPVGSTTVRRADVRIVAATHRDLAAAVADGSWREDLYYRLNVVEVTLPSLAERPLDVALLAGHFLARTAERTGRETVPRLSRRALALLEQHDFPGNVRELENALERALLVARGPRIEPEDLPAAIRRRGEAPGTGGDAPPPAVGGLTAAKKAAVERFERGYLSRCLEASGGNISAAARIARIDYKNFYVKLKRYRIDARAFRPR